MRPPFQLIARLCVTASVFCVSSCSENPSGMNPADLRSGISDGSSRDQSIPSISDLAQRDLAVIRDLTPPPDLAMPPDLLPPVLNPVPACANATVTATMVFPVVMASCDNGGGCHVGAGMAGGLALGSTATSFRNALVNKTSGQSPMQLVNPSQVNTSYLLYKLYNQQFKAGGGGPMPAGGMLSATDQCLFFNWVRSGAN